MLILHQPPPVWGLPSLSPFCVKLETYLRMTKVEYRTAGGNPLQAPKGKVPYVNVDGRLIGDSSLIIDYLKTRDGDPLDKKLTTEQRGLAIAIRRMVEEHLYFAAAWLRWSSTESLPHVRSVFKKMLPPVIGGLIFSRIHKRFLQNLHAQGMGRHSHDEIVAMAFEDLDALSALLGQQSFFLGEQPTTIDATCYGFLIHVLKVPWPAPLKDHAAKLPNLEAYCTRMQERYWPTV